MSILYLSEHIVDYDDACSPRMQIYGPRDSEQGELLVVCHCLPVDEDDVLRTGLLCTTNHLRSHMVSNPEPFDHKTANVTITHRDTNI